MQTHAPVSTSHVTDRRHRATDRGDGIVSQTDGIVLDSSGTHRRHPVVFVVCVTQTRESCLVA